uniref:Uncharacterized protein n=1 Tax=Linum usitatissimum TaxID=4006 RepID=A0A172MLE8_LINUS|nr:hypothetical protein [Linum usitatissimum]
MGHDGAITSHPQWASETQHPESQFETMTPEEQIVIHGVMDTAPQRDRRPRFRTNSRQAMCDIGDHPIADHWRSGEEEVPTRSDDDFHFELLGAWLSFALLGKCFGYGSRCGIRGTPSVMLGRSDIGLAYAHFGCKQYNAVLYL